MWNTLQVLNVQQSVDHLCEANGTRSFLGFYHFSTGGLIYRSLIFFFWSKGHNMSGNMALRTWIYSVLMRHLSCFLSYWSSHQLFKPRCWFLLAFCLARQSNLISWYSVFIHWFPDTLYLSMDYLHDCLHAHSVLTPGFPVTDWLRPRRGKRSASSSVRKSFNVQQFPSQVPKEKCLRYCSLIVADQNASADSWSSNTLHNRCRLLVVSVLPPTSSRHRTPTTVCFLIKGHRELLPAVSLEVQPVGIKAWTNLHDKLPSSLWRTVFKEIGGFPSLPY